MSLDDILMKNAEFKDDGSVQRNEEFNNFMKRVGEVHTLVKDMASGDKTRADAARRIADKYLSGTEIDEDDVRMTVKADRTVINQKAFKNMDNKDSGTMEKNAWMDEVSKDCEKRAYDRKIRQEKGDTFKTMATKAFRREEYDKALSCYNKAIDQVKDNPNLYCDRALTNIKLGKFDKVFDDCYWAQRLNENSFKARLYRAKAHKELEELDKYEECKKELDEMFPQHQDLTKYFLNKREGYYEDEDDENIAIKLEF